MCDEEYESLCLLLPFVYATEGTLKFLTDIATYLSCYFAVASVGNDGI